MTCVIFVSLFSLVIQYNVSSGTDSDSMEAGSQDTGSHDAGSHDTDMGRGSSTSEEDSEPRNGKITKS